MAVSQKELTFASDLRHAFSSVSFRLENGVKSLDGIIEILRLRINTEITFTNNLRRIISLSPNLVSSLSSLESLRIDGIDAIISDFNNEYIQHFEYLNSLKIDVYQPIIKMRDIYSIKNKLIVNNIKMYIKKLKIKQIKFYKIKIKYDKILSDCLNSENELKKLKCNTNGENNDQNLIKSLTNRITINNKLKIKLYNKYQFELKIWNKYQINFHNICTNILRDIQLNEYRRCNIIRDSFSKWVIFITNLDANRNYDIKSLIASIQLINCNNDIQIFIRNTLKLYPQKLPNGPIPPHHSFLYGKLLINSLNKLYKISNKKCNTSTKSIKLYKKSCEKDTEKETRRATSCSTSTSNSIEYSSLQQEQFLNDALSDVNQIMSTDPPMTPCISTKRPLKMSKFKSEPPSAPISAPSTPITPSEKACSHRDKWMLFLR